METEREVKTIEVNLKCPDCEVNMVLESSGVFSSQYTYKCKRCGSAATSSKTYPYIK